MKKLKYLKRLQKALEKKKTKNLNIQMYVKFVTVFECCGVCCCFIGFQLRIIDEVTLLCVIYTVYRISHRKQ